MQRLQRLQQLYRLFNMLHKLKIKMNDKKKAENYQGNYQKTKPLSASKAPNGLVALKNSWYKSVQNPTPIV